jgi:hypothetical protein
MVNLGSGMACRPAADLVSSTRTDPSPVESRLRAHEMLGHSCDHVHLNNPRRAGDNVRLG